jgi:hypothetical protein
MRVTAYVFVRGEKGQMARLAPGDTVPDWATVTNPDVLDGDAPAPKAEEKPEETPEEAPEPETTPEPTPAPRKRTSRKAADS